jgi:hypothetical protein
MNPANILAALTLLESLTQQIMTVAGDIKTAQAGNTDLTGAQVQSYRDAYTAAVAKLDADIAGAKS